MPKTLLGEKGRVKVRIVEVDVEGNDSTLQDTLRTISAAINRATTVAPAKRVDVLAAPAARPTKNGHANGHVEDPAEDVTEVHEDQEVDDGAGAAHSSTQRRRPTTYPQPKPLDIDFNVPAVTLKTFMAEKKPKSHNMKFLAVAAWFKAHGDVEAITSDHVYSAYLGMDWRVRKNMNQPFYFLQGKNWMKHTDTGWTITYIGVDKVKALPAGE